MPSGIKVISFPNIIVVAVAGFFFVVNLGNPGFEDRWWPAAVIGILISILSFIIALVIIVCRHFHIGKYTDTEYFAIGLLNFCFGLSWIILMALQKFIPTILLAGILLLLVGLLIFSDLQFSRKRDNTSH